MEYGASVNGVTDRELTKIQSVALAGMSPAAAGRSKTALLALKGDPSWTAAAAPILQWARMAWKDDTEMPDLMRQAWTAGSVERDHLLTPDGRRRWKLVRGPVGALFLIGMALKRRLGADG